MPPGPLVGLCRSGHQQTGMARLASWIGVIDPGSTLFENPGLGSWPALLRLTVPHATVSQSAAAAGCGFHARAICKREFVIADGCAVPRSDLLPATLLI